MSKKFRNVLIGFFAVLLTTGFSFTLAKEQSFNNAEAGTKTGAYGISWATDFNSREHLDQGEWAVDGGARADYTDKVLYFWPHNELACMFYSSEKYHIATESEGSERITLDFNLHVNAAVNNFVVCLNSTVLPNSYAAATAGYYLYCDATTGWRFYNTSSSYHSLSTTNDDNPFLNLGVTYHIRILRTVTGMNLYIKKGGSSTQFPADTEMTNLGWRPFKTTNTGTYLGLYSNTGNCNYWIDNFMINAGDPKNRTDISSTTSAPGSRLIATIPQTEYVYTGSEIKPTVEFRYNGIKLVQGKHYTVSYSDNTNPGTAKISINGSNSTAWLNLTGTKVVNFTIRYNNYSVVFDGNGATGGSTDTINLSYDTVFTMPECGFTKTGHKFLYWTDSKENRYYPGTQYSRLTLTEGGVYRLYANWTDSYTVNLVPNGGTINFEDDIIPYKYGDTKDLPINVTKQNNRFMGWYDQNGITSGNWGNKVDKILSTDYGDKTFYARWTEYGSNGNDTYSATDTFSGGEIIYVNTGDISSGFNDGWIAVYFTDSNKDNGTWSAISTRTFGSPKTFSILVPNKDGVEWAYLIVTRQSKSSGEASWDTRTDQTEDLLISDIRKQCYNCIKLKSWHDASDSKMSVEYCVCHFNGVYSGDSVYLKASNEWKKDDARFVLHLFDNNLNNNLGINLFMNPVYDGTSNITYYEALAPKIDGINVIFGQYTIARCSANIDNPDHYAWQEYHWNETNNITFNDTKYTYNSVQTWDDNLNWGTLLEDEYTNDERADDYGKFICTRAAGSCDPNGHSDIDTLKDDWSDYESQYSQMNVMAQGRFWLAQADPTAGFGLNRGAFLYDYIYGKYHPVAPEDFEDFVYRQPAVRALAFRFGLFDGSVESNNALMIIIVSIITVGAFSYFLIKRRKED